MREYYISKKGDIMFHIQVFGIVVSFTIIIFNITLLYRVITSKSHVNFDLVTKITINQRNAKILIFNSILNILLMLVNMFSIWIVHIDFISIISFIFIVDMCITRYKIYKLR